MGGVEAAQEAVASLEQVIDQGLAAFDDENKVGVRFYDVSTSQRGAADPLSCRLRAVDCRGATPIALLALC